MTEVVADTVISAQFITVYTKEDAFKYEDLSRDFSSSIFPVCGLYNHTPDYNIFELIGIAFNPKLFW